MSISEFKEFEDGPWWNPPREGLLQLRPSEFPVRHLALIGDKSGSLLRTQIGQFRSDDFSPASSTGIERETHLGSEVSIPACILLSFPCIMCFICS